MSHTVDIDTSIFKVVMWHFLFCISFHFMANQIQFGSLYQSFRVWGQKKMCALSWSGMSNRINVLYRFGLFNTISICSITFIQNSMLLCYSIRANIHPTELWNEQCWTDFSLGSGEIVSIRFSGFSGFSFEIVCACVRHVQFIRANAFPKQHLHKTESSKIAWKSAWHIRWSDTKPPH